MRRTNLTGGSTVDESIDIGAISKSLTPVKAEDKTSGDESKPVVKNLRDAKHGELVKTEDGDYGIVIDTQEEFNKKYHDESMDRLFSLGLDNDPLFDAIAIKTQPTENVYEAICAKFGPNSENARRFRETKEEFAKYTYGPEGLVSVDDPRAAEYKYKIDLIRSGKVRLPTVSEYDEQLKALKAEKARRNESMENNNQTNDNPNTPIEEVVPPQRMVVVDPKANVSGVQPIRRTPEPPPKPAQPQRVLGAEPIQRQHLADAMPHNDNTPQQPVTPQPQPQVEPYNAQYRTTTVQPMQQRQQPSEEPPRTVQQPDVQTTPTVPQQPQAPTQRIPEPPRPQQRQPEAPQPINLARAMAEQELNKKTPPPPVVEQKPALDVAPENVTFEVPEESVPIFYDTLPEETKHKVEASKVVRINAVSLKDVPTATRRITSVDQYRSAIPRAITGNLVQKVLINSGYIVTMKGATSLEMATIAYQQEIERPDWPKEIQFCYDHLVDTSIGKMTYSRFLQETSSLDVPTMLAAIYQASEPDIKSLTVKCGNPTCRQDEEIEFVVPNIWDDSDFDEETINYFNDVVAAQTDVDKAIEVHQRAPVMQINYLKFGDTYFSVKQTDCQMAMNYYPIAPDLATNFNQLVAVLSAFIKDVRVVDTTSERALASPEGKIVYISEQLEVICNTIVERLDNDEDQGAFSDFILRKLPELKQYKFTMRPARGDAFVCPKCGDRRESMPIMIDQMIFFKAQSAVMPR